MSEQPQQDQATGFAGHSPLVLNNRSADGTLVLA